MLRDMISQEFLKEKPMGNVFTGVVDTMVWRKI